MSTDDMPVIPPLRFERSDTVVDYDTETVDEELFDETIRTRPAPETLDEDEDLPTGTQPHLEVGGP